MKHNYTPLSAKASKRVRFEGDSKSIDDFNYSVSSSAEEISDLEELRSYRYAGISPLSWLIHITLLLISTTMLVITITYRSSTLQHVQKYSAWSAAASAVQYEHVIYNVSTSGRFTGAGPEVDKAWREISFDMGDQWLAESDIQKLGMPTTSIQVAHPKTGESGWRVGMEVFHQLHCLDLLRKITFKEYYTQAGAGAFAHGEDKLRQHADHCLEVLRLNLQCNADIGLFTLYLEPGDPLAWPQLNSKHVCRNFDNVLAWAKENSVGNMEL